MIYLTVEVFIIIMLSSHNIAIISIATIVSCIILDAIYVAGTTPVTYASEDTIELKEKVILIGVQPAILNKIADCESGERTIFGNAVEGSATHYNKDGSVKLGAFTDPQYGQDVGKYQINTLYHQEEAERLGLDLWDETDNATYARYLYEQSGTDPWLASESCWGTI